MRIPFSWPSRSARRLLGTSVPVCALATLLLAATASAQWPQWGGPDRDFRSPTTGLAEEWPKEGPPKLWERPLGAGFSSIVVDDERLFTMYRSGEEEVVVALSARTGETEWEHRVRTKRTEPPNSTPTLVGDKLYTLGFTGVLSALEKHTGNVVWSHDLVADLHGKPPQYGYASSPLAFEGSLLVTVGGPDQGLAAFDLEDGSLLWHAQDLEEVYSSPIRIEVEGETQVVVLAAGQLVGLDPKSGELLWREPIEGEQPIATPVWCTDGLLCVTASMGGSVGLRFSKVDGKTRVEHVWRNESLKIGQTTVVRAGDFFYGSADDSVTAFDARSGGITWKGPGLSLANVLAADDKLVLLDYEGTLGLATALPDQWKVTSTAKLLEREAFTTPTLVGQHLYLRDQKRILALDLGVRGGEGSAARPGRRSRGRRP